MNAKHQILLAVDGSEASLCAVRYAAKVFSTQKTELVLFHVRPTLPEAVLDNEKIPTAGAEDLPLDAWQADQAAFIEKFMKTAKSALAEAGFPPAAVSEAVRQAEHGVARDILEESRGGYAALVVGRTGFSAPGGGFKGSVADKLIEQMTHLPLVVVGGAPETRKIIVSFDRSGGTRKCVSCVGTLIEPDDREVILCNVIRPLSAYGTGAELLPTAESRNWLEKKRQQVIPHMKTAKQELISAGFVPEQISREILTDNISRAGAVLDEAAKRGCGSIVVGKRGLTIVDEFVMGRVCRKIVSRADQCAVWVVN